jgi:AcrR family transcriptional regulator
MPPSSCTTEAMDAKRSALISAAVSAFTEHGFAATTIGQIADIAGIGKGTVYLYFPSKEDLLLACCLDLTRAYDDQIFALVQARYPALLPLMHCALENPAQVVAIDHPEARTMIPAALEDILAEVVARPRYISTMFIDLFKVLDARAEAQSTARASLQAMFACWESMTAGLLRSGIAGGHLRPLPDVQGYARLMVCAVDGLLLQRVWSAHTDTAAEARRLARCFLSPLLVNP